MVLLPPPQISLQVFNILLELLNLRLQLQKITSQASPPLPFTLIQTKFYRPSVQNSIQLFLTIFKRPLQPQNQNQLLSDSISSQEKEGEKDIPGIAVNIQQSKGKKHLVVSASGPITRRSRGRLILIRHVLSSMAIHLAATLPLPSSTCNALESAMRKFLWSGNANSSKINYVKWATVTLSKAEGGLDVRRLSKINAASSIKLGWQASTGDSIWSSWFKNKYFKHHPI
ncbi:hypothetical protein MRB53_014316 [Persea americana]|uniref:Uncharacterized protein n=1 Tax=Persea americana TaxID=3435 RepID=A0ACC2KAF1_PERAE|nr:hypothetical protein MRB53_014316 [Persea americana]